MEDLKNHPEYNGRYILGPVGIWPFKYRLVVGMGTKSDWRLKLQRRVLTGTRDWTTVKSGGLHNNGAQTEDHRKGVDGRDA